MNTSEIKKENLINLYNDKGQKHGYWKHYYCYTDSALYSKGYFVNGQKHGYWEEYYSNGQLWYKENYVNGKRHGYCVSYWSNGKLESKGNYVNGNRHGYWEIYYRNGDLKYKGYLDMGKEVDYNPDEPKVIELTLTEIANKLNIDVNQLRIKE